MEALLKFIQSIEKGSLFNKNDRLLLAVSGGVDSVVLVELCKKAGFDFSIAHCNFNLRGQESKRDEDFVRSLASTYNVTCFVRQFDTNEYANAQKLSVQEAARNLRYEWFENLVRTGEANAKYLVTAHQADDNAETVAMHFFRGTGLHGLTGIPASTSWIRRPLLSFTKNELVDFARSHKLEFVEDASNASSKYTRNYFRNEILPAIAKVYPQVMQNLQENIGRFQQIESLYRFSTGELIRKMTRIKGGERHIPYRQLLGFGNNALVYEWIAPFGFSGDQVEEVTRLAQGDSGSYIVSPNGQFRIIKHRHWFILAPVASSGIDHHVIESAGQIAFDGGILDIESVSPKDIPNDDNIACLDAKKIRFPLLLRKWKTGDYFYPLGMKKKKKLARFFIDRKLSKTEKERIWVLESASHILWVVGHRIDDRFKITPSTAQVLRVAFTPFEK